MKAIFKKSEIDNRIKKRFKTKYKKRISINDINKIWKDWVYETIEKPLNVGSVVNIDKKSKIWVKAIPLHKHKRAMSLRNKGLTCLNGKIQEAKVNFDTSKYIYKIVFETDRMGKDIKLFYKAHPKIKKSVNDGIINGKLITRL